MKKILLAILCLLIIASIALVFIESGGDDFLNGIVTYPTALVFGFIAAPLGIMILISAYGAHYFMYGLVSVILMVYGIVKHKDVYGQIMAVIGIVAWTFLGVYGLGHGG